MWIAVPSFSPSMILIRNDLTVAKEVTNKCRYTSLFALNVEKNGLRNLQASICFIKPNVQKSLFAKYFISTWGRNMVHAMILHCIWMYHKKETFSNLFVSPNGENTRIIFFKPRKFEPEIVQLFYFQKDRVLCTMIYFETNFFSNCLLLCACFIRHLWFKSYCAVEHFNPWSPRIGYIYLN